MNTRPTIDSQNVRDRVLTILSELTSSRNVLTQPNLPLYESGLVDSLGTVSLILAFDEEFGISISPAELDRQAWATPEKLVEDIRQRIASAQSASTNGARG